VIDEKWKALIASSGLMVIGVYARAIFGERKFTLKELVGMGLFGMGIVYLLSLTSMAPIYQSSLSMVGGILSREIISIIMKIGKKQEDRIANRINKKIDNMTD
jgi:hypothetical protein